MGEHRKRHRLSAWTAVLALSAAPAAFGAGDDTSTPPLTLAAGADPVPAAPNALGCRLVPCAAAAPKRSLRLHAGTGWGATLVEFPQTAPVGQPRRSRHGLGVRSPLLESALQDMGVEARHCLAPVVRMHTKVSSAFAVSGTLWIYARCTFD